MQNSALRSNPNCVNLQDTLAFSFSLAMRSKTSRYASRARCASVVVDTFSRPGNRKTSAAIPMFVAFLRAAAMASSSRFTSDEPPPDIFRVEEFEITQRANRTFRIV